MSGMQNNLEKSDQSKEEEAPGQPFASFNLEKEEIFNLPSLGQQLIFIESEDQLECFMHPSEDASGIIPIKEEEEEDYVEYLSFSSVEQEKGLSSDIQAVKDLQEKCRLIQQIITATSQQPIYDYEIGFESDEEETHNKNPKMDQDCFLSKSPFCQQVKEEDLVKMEAEDEPVSGLIPSSLLQESDKILTLITSLENSFDSVNLPWVIELVVCLRQNGITSEEKKRFLTIFEKLESMRRGIMMKMAEMNKNEHQCKVCGDKFDTGRKLGGHMSRRHPGYSFEYFVKKQVHKTKSFERSRRKYFKNQKGQKVTKKTGDSKAW